MSGHGAVVTALLAFRLTGLIWIAPVYSSRGVPSPVKASLIVLLAAVMWPAAMASAPTAVRIAAPGVLSELLVGLTLGMGAAVFVAAAESAGDMLAVQMGLSGANVLDPMSRTQLPVLGHFLGLFVTTLILASGGHLVILRALEASLESIPVGVPIDFTAGSFALARLGGTLLWLGLKFAAPVVAAMMIGNATLGILSRTVPQLNVLVVAFPLQIGIGLFVLAATLPYLAAAFTDWGGQYRALSFGVLEHFVPGLGGS